MEHSSAISQCPICNAKALEQDLELSDHFLTKQAFALKYCPNCEVKITTPRPHRDEMAQYYASDEYVSHSDTDKGLINFAYQQVKKITLRQKLHLINNCAPNKTGLDYGCGTGDFVRHIKKHGWSTIGVEPDADARSLGVKKGLEIYPLDWVNSANRAFGAITLWHVLEHTFDPLEVLRALRGHLVKDGVLVIAVPNYNSFDAQFYAADWAAYDVPRHLYHFSPNTMRTIAEKLDMKIVETKGMPFDSYYVSMLSEKYRGGNKVKGVLTGLRSNIAALKTGQFSSMIYVLRK